MPKLFDTTCNTLVDAHITDWSRFLAIRAGLPIGPARPLDTDLSISLQSDRIFHIDGPSPYALHLELESSSRLGIPFELMRYNVLAHGVIRLPVHSVLVLLRPKAQASDQTGSYETVGVDGRPYLHFRYTVVRVWQETVEGLLAAGLGFAPLVMLTDEATSDPERAFDRLWDRLRTADVPAKVAEDLLDATFWLGGLRYEQNHLEELYRRVNMTLEDSSTYQGVLKMGMDKGAVLGSRATILRMGEKRFQCSPPAEVQAAILAIADRERLNRIADRLLAANNWEGLLEGE